MKQRAPLALHWALLRAALLAPAALVACTSIEVDEPDPEELLELYMTTATYLYQDESMERAQDQAVKALGIDPKNRPMRKMIGWIRLRQGRTEDLLIARRFFEDLAREGGDDVAVLLGLATAQERLGTLYDESGRAIASGERTTDAPDSKVRAAELAASARASWREALANYERVLSAGPSPPLKAMNGLQRVHALLGNYDDSLVWARQLLERSRAEAAGYGRILHNADLTETEERVARLSEGDAIDLQVETHLFAATLLRQLGRDREAIEHLDRVVELTPDLSEAYSLRAQLRSNLGRYREAIEDIDRFLGTSEAPFDHPDIRTAYDLRSFCEAQLD